MTTEEITARVEAIRRIGTGGTRDCDCAAAHQEQDRLYEDFIAHVAERGTYLDELGEQAAIVLEVKKMDFTRWYE